MDVMERVKEILGGGEDSQLTPKMDRVLTYTGLLHELDDMARKTPFAYRLLATEGSSYSYRGKVLTVPPGMMFIELRAARPVRFGRIISDLQEPWERQDGRRPAPF